MSEHDRQHVIEVDGNCPVDVIIEKLLQKLDTYTSRRAVVPQLLKEIDEEESEAPQLDEESVCVFFIDLLYSVEVPIFALFQIARPNLLRTNTCC